MKQIDSRIEPLSDGAFLNILRKGKLETRLRMGPNHVHAFITHPDGSIEDLGISANLLTNSGRDLWADAFGHKLHVSGSNSTASSATSLTISGLTASQFKGWRIWVPVTGVTTAPVYGNVGDNTTGAVTVDQWWTAADGTGTTPAAASAWMASPTCVPRFMALTTDVGPASASHTALAGEILPGAGTGCGRAKATYAHTNGTNTYTEQVVYSVTGAGHTAIHMMGLFTASTNTAGGILVFETVLNADATVANGDTLTVTDTITLT